MEFPVSTKPHEGFSLCIFFPNEICWTYLKVQKVVLNNVYFAVAIIKDLNMYSITVDKDIILEIKEVDIDFLVPHEKVLLDKKDILKNNLRYKNDYIIISTIIVCSESNLIIDGHHRYTALKELGYNKIPVTIINYFSNNIITDDKDSLSKNKIISNSLNDNLLKPKTTKHLVYCNKNKSWFPITLLSSLYLLKSTF